MCPPVSCLEHPSCQSLACSSLCLTSGHIGHRQNRRLPGNHPTEPRAGQLKGERSCMKGSKSVGQRRTQAAMTQGASSKGPDSEGPPICLTIAGKSPLQSLPHRLTQQLDAIFTCHNLHMPSRIWQLSSQVGHLQCIEEEIDRADHLRPISDSRSSTFLLQRDIVCVLLG